MSKLIIGSSAIKFHFDDFPRTPKDIDFFITNNNFIKNQYDKVYDTYILSNTFKSYWEIWKNLEYIPTEHLYTLKMSHLYWNVNWQKHVNDFLFLQSKKCSIDKTLHDLFYAEWQHLYGNKKVNLKKDTDTFFNSNIDRIYSHDDLHKMVAYRDKPWFEDLNVEGEKALMSKKKFFDLSLEEQLQVCREEINVIALERELLPSNFKVPILAAYRRAVKKVVIDLSKGWFPEFILHNLTSLWKPDDFFLYKIKNTQWQKM